jgi:hypothetical protein
VYARVRRPCEQAGAAAWSPAAAALQQLHADQPELVDRMERTVAQAKIMRGNRKYRLDSLGASFSLGRRRHCAAHARARMSERRVPA